MSNLHPKLNWKTFNEELKKRKKRRAFLLWFYGVFTVALLAYVGYCHIYSGEKGTELSEPFDVLESSQPVEKQNINSDGLSRGRYNEPKKSQRASKTNENHSTLNTSSIKGVQEAAFAADSIAFNKKANPLNLVVKRSPELNPAALRILKKVEGAALFGAVLRISEQHPNQHLDVPYAMQCNHLYWHSARFNSNDMAKYRALNSLQFSARIGLFENGDYRVSVSPNFEMSRYQMQYYSEYQGTIYEPGSILGYRRIVDSIIPIYGDTLAGTYRHTVRKNGTINELYIPLAIHRRLLSSKGFDLQASLSGGLLLRTKVDAYWADENAVYAVENTAVYGGEFRTGLAASYQQNHTRVFIGYQSSYQTHVLPHMRKLYHGMYSGLVYSF